MAVRGDRDIIKEYMKVVFRTLDGKAIKTWVNMEYSKSGIPCTGDFVTLHWGDDCEESETYSVMARHFDGRDVDTVVCIVSEAPRMGGMLDGRTAK